MSFTVWAGIGSFLVFAMIGVFILVRHDSLQSETNNLYLVIGALQAGHILLYLTGGLDQIAQFNVYFAFGICAAVSILCLVMSGWLLPVSKFRHGIKYLLMFLAILQVIGTVLIFLLPDAGIPPLIRF